MDLQPPLREINNTENATLKYVKGHKRRDEHLTLSSISSVYVEPCCENDCCSSYSVDEIFMERELYWSKNVEQQRAFIFAQLRNSVSYQFAVCGKYLCERGWRQIYGIKERRFHELKKRFKLRLSLPYTQTKLKTPSRVRLQARSWFNKYLRLHAERMPDREEFHLPHCVSKDAIFKQYEAAMITASETPFSQSSFNDMWLKEFPHVKIARGTNGQPKCMPCTNIAVALNMTLTPEERTMIEEKRKLHFTLQGDCRSKYYKHIKKAKENPQTYVSVIIDNMDQAKTRLPKFAMYSKENDGRMPPTLYLQADNSGKDNKNSFVMIFLAWLVKMKIFRKVKLGFLMVGHTHEDIDQVFSRISAHLARMDAPTLPTLHDGIRSSTSPAPIVSHLTGLYNYKEHLEGCRGLIEGISGPHQFVFKEIDSRIIMTYKNWPLDSEEGRTLDLTPHIPDFNGLQGVQVNEKMKAEGAKMETDLRKWNDSGRLSEEHLNWWQNYLADQDVISPNVPLVTCLPTFHIPERHVADTTHLQNAIIRNAEKEEKSTSLRLKKRKTRI